MILVGFFILMLNLTLSMDTGMIYYPFILGLFFLLLYIIYEKNPYFSFCASQLMSLGLYIILLLTDLLPQGGDSAIVFFMGLGFLVFYLIEGKWKSYWPLIPGLTVTIFGALLYQHTTEKLQFDFIETIGKYWPLLIVTVGIISLFYNPIKALCNKLIQKITKSS